MSQSYYVLISGLELAILLLHNPRARITTSGYCGFVFVCLFLEEVNNDILIKRAQMLSIQYLHA